LQTIGCFGVGDEGLRAHAYGVHVEGKKPMRRERSLVQTRSWAAQRAHTPGYASAHEGVCVPLTAGGKEDEKRRVKRVSAQVGVSHVSMCY
jgi:hypothetical protein